MQTRECVRCGEETDVEQGELCDVCYQIEQEEEADWICPWCGKNVDDCGCAEEETPW